MDMRRTAQRLAELWDERVRGNPPAGSMTWGELTSDAEYELAQGNAVVTREGPDGRTRMVYAGDAASAQAMLEFLSAEQRPPAGEAPGAGPQGPAAPARRPRGDGSSGRGRA